MPTSSTSYRFRPIPIHPVVDRLSHTTQTVLSWLLWHRNSKTGQCNPRVETLAKESGCSLATVTRALRQLRISGILRITRGQRGSSYEITDPENWVTVKHRMPRRQMSLFPPEPAAATPDQSTAPPVTDQRDSNSDRSELTDQERRFLYELLKLFLNYGRGAERPQTTSSSEGQERKPIPAPAPQGGARFPLFWQCFVNAGVALNARDKAISQRMFAKYSEAEQETIGKWVIQQLATVWRSAEFTPSPMAALRSEGWTRKAAERIVPKPMSRVEREIHEAFEEMRRKGQAA